MYPTTFNDSSSLFIHRTQTHVQLKTNRLFIADKSDAELSRPLLGAAAARCLTLADRTGKRIQQVGQVEVRWDVIK